MKRRKFPLTETLETTLKHSLEHMKWADARIVHRLSELGADAPPEVVRWLAHIAAAERVWLSRMREEEAGVAVWPEPDLEACAKLSRENAQGFERLLKELAACGFRKDAVYKNSSGTEFRTGALDILTHVFMHGAYHRGQINAALRKAGCEPINVDYITYVRER
jgi:uncharacterized damage-inducible protein DinB